MKTVGQILLSQRKNKGWTLEEVHKFIKVQPKYIKALETGDYALFDNKVQVKGFLKIYAQFLELNVDQVMAFWRREYEAIFEKNYTKPDKVPHLGGLENPKFVITPRAVFVTVVSVLILGFFTYLFYQYRSYSGAPDLAIFNPSDSQVLTTEILDVTGKTERDSIVYINNQRIILNTDGTFATSIKLNPGLNTLSFSATNSLGKATEISKTVIYRPDEEDAPVLNEEVAGESTESTPAEELDNLIPDSTPNITS